MTDILAKMKLTLSAHAKTWRLVCDHCGEVPSETLKGFAQGDECPRCCPPGKDHGGTLYWEGDQVPYDGYDFAKPSLAVVACNCGDGAILWYVGGHLAFEIEEGYGNQLGDLGLDHAPHGISIWEGKVIYTQSEHFEGSMECDSDTVGEFRRPTPEEWAKIQEGCNPWDRSEWMLKWPIEP